MIGNRRVSAVPLALAMVLVLSGARRAAGQSASGAASAGMQNPFLGSVPTGQATATPVPLSLKDSFDRALKYNLGVIEADQGTRAARAARLRSLSALLPNLSARISGTVEQINLKALGFNLHIPGVNIPTIVGPFSVADARASLSQEVFNWADVKNLKSSAESEKASQYTYQNDRNLVVLTTADAYLLVISDAATEDSTKAQVDTATALNQKTSDQHKAGVVAAIDELRSRVELQNQQQRLIAAQDQLAIDKLTLARVIGLPNGQEFRLTDAVPYAPLAAMSLDETLQQAYAKRADYQSAKGEVRSAELALQGAAAENYPSLSLDTNFGDIGSPNFATSHETFSFEASLNVPIFQGTRVRADKLQADSALRQRKAELEDLRGKIDDEVRTAFLNLKSSSDLVEVARSNIDLAHQTLTQAQDRFSSGVADNLEVVQAQESVASAEQSYIASLYAYNLAKVSLAQAMGIAEQSALQFLGRKVSMATTPTETAERRESGSPGAPGVGPGRVPARRRKGRGWIILLLIVAALIAISIPLYRYLASYESTDDAEIDGYIYPVSARVAGYVVRVTVDDNQLVQAGTVIAQLDPKDYEVAVVNAKATFANLRSSSEAARINVPLTSVNTSTQLSTAGADVDNAQAGLTAAERQFDAAQATLRQAEATDLKAQDDVSRYKPLAAKDEIPQQQYTQAVDSQKATAAAVEAARSSAAAAEQAVTGARARVTQAQAGLHYAETRPQQISVQRSRAQAAEAQMEQAQAALQQAQLNLQYATVVAPVSGIVGQRSVQQGQNVSPGQQLMTIVPLDSDNIWVTADFKETQLKYMRPGQPVKISVDTYHRDYNGHVLNIGGATGARYSLLPPENATGNYVKVVQRIPVKILFEKGQDPEHILRPGMSVEPTVTVK